MGVKFDVEGARKSGYTDAEIADAIGKQAGFDTAAARGAGHADTDIISHLTGAPVIANRQIDARPGLSPADEARKRVAEEQGTGEAILVGAGRTFDRVGKGIQQLWNGATGDEQANAALKARAQDDDAAYKPLEKAHPIATAVGESLPAMVVPVGGAGGALATAGRLATSAAIPAALEYGTAEERAKRAAGAGVGAVVGGQIVPKVAGALGSAAKSVVGEMAPGMEAMARAVAGKISPEVLALAEKAKAMGIPVNMSQLSDSKFMKTLQSVVEQMPFTGGAKTAAKQKTAYNKAIAATFGADAEKITPEVYNYHKKRLGAQFEDLAARNNLEVSPELKNKLASILDDAVATGSDDTIKAVKNIFGRVAEQSESNGGKVAADVSPLVDAAGKQIVKAAASETPVNTKLAGTAYSSIDSELGRIIKGGGEKSMYAKRMQEAIRLAMDDSISAADQAAWSQTRNQYKNLKAVRNAVAKDDMTGEISPGALMNALNNTEAGKEAMAMGVRGNLGDLAQIGKRFVSDKIPNSGTAQRGMAMNLITGGGAGVAGAMAPMTTLGVLAGSATLGKTVNTVINSPKVVAALGKQGLTVGDLAKLPPSKVVQILGGITGMSAAELLEN